MSKNSVNQKKPEKKSGRGGPRPNSGRKSKKEELGLVKLIDEAVSHDEFIEIFQALALKAVKGSVEHAKLLLAYKYGKPDATVNMMGSLNVTHAPAPVIKKILQQKKK